MAKRFRLSPGSILFLIAIVILIGALIAVIVVISSSCRADKAQAQPSASPTATAVSTATPPPTDDPFATDTPEPITSSDPNASAGPSDTDEPGMITETPNPNGTVSIATPPGTATPAPTTKIYTSPTSAQKKAAKAGYVYKDKVKMRKGPGTSYDVVRDSIPKNTAVTLYELQDGWWFLKCGTKYGYIRKDMIKEGETTITETGDGNTTFEGTIKTNSVAALRKKASKSSKAIKEMSNGTKVTVYYKTKDSSGNTWYYISDGKSKGYVYGSLISTSKKVPTR